MYLWCLLVALQTTAQTGVSWFRSYEGAIGKTPFTLLLHKAGNNYSAYVYYAKTALPYQLSGQGQRIITLTGSPAGSEDTEKWLLTIVGARITGSFILKNKTTALTAKETNAVPGANYVYVDKTIKLNPADKASPTASYYQSGIWFTGNKPLNELLWRNIGNNTAGQQMLKYRDEYFQSYKEENKDVKPSDYKESVYMFSHESQSKMLISYVSEHLLVLSSDDYMYSGGAHGIFGTSHQVIDKRNNTFLEIQQLIKDTAALVPLLEKHYRRMYAVPEGQTLMEAGLFVNNIPVNDNFFLTEKYLGFTYNPYEIGPYAAGVITIYIPIEECKELLTGQALGLITNEQK